MANLQIVITRRIGFRRRSTDSEALIRAFRLSIRESLTLNESEGKVELNKGDSILKTSEK